MLIVGNLLADLLLKAVDPRILKILTSDKLAGFNVCFRKFITSSAPTVVISWHIPTKCWTRWFRLPIDVSEHFDALSYLNTHGSDVADRWCGIGSR